MSLDSAGPPRVPTGRVASALDIHIWCSGHGYTKAEVHWTQGLVASRQAHRTLLASAFTPGEMLDVEQAVAILAQFLEDLRKTG